MNHLYVFGPFQLLPGRGLKRENEIVNMPPKVFAALCLLVESQGEVVSKQELMESVWPESYVGENSLTQAIFLLRKILGKTDSGAEYIETFPKRGYRITVPVRIVLPSSSPALTLSHDPIEVAPVSLEIPSAPAIHLEAAESRTLPDFTEDNPQPSASSVRRRRVLLAAIGILLLLSLVILVQSGRLGWQKPSVVKFTRLTNDGMYKERLIPLLSDGSRVYFSEDLGTDSYLAEASTSGGETVRRPSPSPVSSALSYSPVRKEIIFGSLWEQSPSSPFLSMSLPEGTVHSFNELSGHAASWSPDGRQIAFAKEMNLYVANADGTGVREIARMPQVPYWPRWSPDGKRIRFSLQRWTDSVALWEIGEDGQGLHELFVDEPWAKEACCGDWTPDGRYYVFVVEEARRSSLWIARENAGFWQRSAPTQLVEGPVDFWRAPLAAADGSHIFALGEQARGELIKYDPASKQFQPYLDGISSDTISFSRDGQWMAYTTYPEGTLWRSRIDGSERMKLTEPPGLARFPQWSPDGTQIVYITATADHLWKAEMVSVNGGKKRSLGSGPTSQGVATWSPDGRRIAFGQIIMFGVGKKDELIRILDLEKGTSEVLPQSNGLWTARWSPDGRYLSAVTTDNQRLKLYDFQTSTWSELADVGINDVVWSKNGQIYFDSPKEAAIFRVDVKTRAVERYASLQGIRRTGFFGWSLNLAPDGAPLLLRETGIHEVYSIQVRLP